MQSCFGCLALFVLIIVVSYDAWLAVGWLLDTFFDMGGTLPGIMLQVFGAGIAIVGVIGLAIVSLLKR